MYGHAYAAIKEQILHSLKENPGSIGKARAKEISPLLTHSLTLPPLPSQWSVLRVVNQNKGQESTKRPIAGAGPDGEERGCAKGFP